MLIVDQRTATQSPTPRPRGQNSAKQGLLERFEGLSRRGCDQGKGAGQLSGGALGRIRTCAHGSGGSECASRGADPPPSRSMHACDTILSSTDRSRNGEQSHLVIVCARRASSRDPQRMAVAASVGEVLTDAACCRPRRWFTGMAICPNAMVCRSRSTSPQAMGRHAVVVVRLEVDGDEAFVSAHLVAKKARSSSLKLSRA